MTHGRSLCARLLARLPAASRDGGRSVGRGRRSRVQGRVATGTGTGPSAEAIRAFIDSRGWNIENADVQSPIRFDDPPRITAFTMKGQPVVSVSNLGDATASAIESATGLTSVQNLTQDPYSGQLTHCFTGTRDAVDRAWGYLWWQVARSRQLGTVAS